MAGSAHTSINLQEVLFDNALEGKAFTYTETEIAGFEIQNMLDWRDFSVFRELIGGFGQIDFTMTEDTVIDTLAFFYVANTGFLTDAVEVYYESAPAVFTLLQSSGFVDNRVMRFSTFTQTTVLSGRKIRIAFIDISKDIQIRSLVVGERLQFLMGQWSGINPPQLNQGVVVGNPTAVNGSFLGRNQRRAENRGMIKLENLSQTWVRDNWNPFSIAATSHAFFHRWNPTEFPSETAFTVGEIMAPKNESASLMSVEMPTMFIVE